MALVQDPSQIDPAHKNESVAGNLAKNYTLVLVAIHPYLTKVGKTRGRTIMPKHVIGKVSYGLLLVVLFGTASGWLGGL